MSKMKVNASGLNLRSAPVTEPGNIILVLPRGHEVETLDDARTGVPRGRNDC
jgi:hypothetical protein